MNTILTVTREFIRLFKREVHESAVLVTADDVFEVKNTPSVILQGPVLSENAQRRTQARLIERNVPDLTYEECKAPRLYHLDFDIVVTTATETELLGLQEAIARLFQTHPVLEIADKGIAQPDRTGPGGRPSPRESVESAPGIGTGARRGLPRLRRRGAPRETHPRPCSPFPGRRGGKPALHTMKQGGTVVIEIKNLLFQPLTFHLAGDGRGLHLNPRGRKTLSEDEISPEIRAAAKRGFVSLTPARPIGTVSDGDKQPKKPPTAKKKGANASTDKKRKRG